MIAQVVDNDIIRLDVNRLLRLIGSQFPFQLNHQ